MRFCGNHNMLRLAFYAVLLSFALMISAIVGLAWWVLPQLPPTESLQDVRFQTPLKVYTRDGSLIAEFGEKFRTPVAIKDVPILVKQAFLAAEDDRFYEHPGVDGMALLRAAFNVARSQERSQGGSTITMQVARNFFLSREKTYQRKLREIALAIKIERELTKNQILELYLNKIFLGHRAYGVAAAAQVYFGCQLKDLTLAQIALIAGLPKAPSRLNPVTDPRAAVARRGYVLSRMLELGFINREAFAAAQQEPLIAHLHGQAVETNAPHLAEMARTFMGGKFGEAAFTQGYRVITTILHENQTAAVNALTSTLTEYDRRHGYRGPEANLNLAATPSTKWAELLNAYPSVGDLAAVIVTTVGEREIEALDAQGNRLKIGWSGMSWARRHISPDQVGPTPHGAGDFLKPGDVIRISWVASTPNQHDRAHKTESGGWRLAQKPAVEAALVSLDSGDGAIMALVGGYNFALSKFNRVTQALRQPGSNFKPFIYSAALNNGFTPASYINDAPIVFDAPGLDAAWRPENYTGTYYGPTSLRDALANSRNLVSIRVMREVGIDKTLAHISRFGFDPAKMPHNLSLSLGTGEVTPLQLITGYATFSNGGFLIEPYFVSRVEDQDGKVVWRATPKKACPTCELTPPEHTEPGDLEALRSTVEIPAEQRASRVIDAQNAWLMYSMLKDVITRGTARRALELKRPDLAGKTGTTNDLKDAWFSGFNGHIVTTAWIGSDNSTTLGSQETGAHAALPMWIEYMRSALKGKPLAELALPPGMVTVRVQPNSTAAASYETFRAQDVPQSAGGSPAAHPQAAPPPSKTVEQLF